MTGKRLIYWAAAFALAASACAEDEGAGLTCGAGTHQEGGQCLADENADTDRGRRELDLGVEDSGDAGSTSSGETDSGISATPDVSDAIESPEPEVITDVGGHDATTSASDTRNPDAECLVEHPAIGFWDGTFEGTVWGNHALTGPFNLPVAGTVSFEIFCEETKLLIEGEMDGQAQGLYPFRGDLEGEFDPDTNEIDMDLYNASVTIEGFNVEFIADVTGLLVGEVFQNGVWSGHSTFPTGAFGQGTWTASARP